jgi:hypothetical protein
MEKLIQMSRFSKTVLSLTVLLFCISHFAIADRGVGKRNKNKVILNINTPFSLRNSIQFNLKSGLKYKGSLMTNQQTIGSSIMNTSIITYEKGNTTYIIPYKHQVIMPETSSGYSGLKFIIYPGR